MTVSLLSPATVFYLRGAGAPLDYLTGWCSGVFDRPPYTPKRIDYPADMSNAAMPTGISMFDTAVRSTAGNMIAVGHSEGSQVLSAWMAKYDSDPSAPGPERLQFVLTGNPLRYNTGKLIGGFVVGGGFGVVTSTATRWKILDVARRYDGWAIKGPLFSPQWWGMFWAHPNYRAVNLFDPANPVVQNGNTATMTTP